jgi:hypothetical protein
LLALAGFLAAPLLQVQGQEKEEESAAGSQKSAGAAAEYARLLEELRSEFPDRDSAQEGSKQVAARLQEFIDRHPGAPESGQARALAGEVMLLGGDREGARRIWEELARQGPSDEDRARGLYLLGDYYYLRDAATSKRRARYLQIAYGYFRALRDHFPDSRWMVAARRPLRYLDLIKEKTLPAFEATFRQGEKELEVSQESLRGKLVLMDFWRAKTRNQRDFEQTLQEGLAAALREYPELDGRVQVLGVNLDRDRGTFEAAVKEWRLSWPQHHDGKGFDSPLVSLFGIPRLPHWAVVDPEGKILYLGADRQRFFEVATAALRRLRGAGQEGN